MKIVIEYYVDGDHMTDEEFNNQEPRTFEISKDDLIEYMLEKATIGKDEWIVTEDIDVSVEN